MGLSAVISNLLSSDLALFWFMLVDLFRFLTFCKCAIYFNDEKEMSE